MKKKQKAFIAAVRKRGNASGHQGENERQRKQKGEQGHIKRVTRKFLVVVVQGNGKEMYQKSVLQVQSCFFAN